MRRAANRVWLALCLAWCAACERGPVTGTPDTRSGARETIAASRAHANPPCTHHWRDNWSDHDWFADTNWVELSAPGVGASVCFDVNPIAPVGAIISSGNVVIAALTITRGFVAVSAGRSLTVTGDIVISDGGTLELDADASSSASVTAENIENSGNLTSWAPGGVGAPPNNVAANVHQVRSGIDGGDILLFNSFNFVKTNFAWINDGADTRTFSGFGGRHIIPASTGSPTVTQNSGSIGPVTMQAGSFTVNGGSAVDVVLEGTNITFGPSANGTYQGILIRPGAGHTSQLTGDIPAFSTGSLVVEGAGNGTTASLELIGNVTSHAWFRLEPGPGAILNLTGSGQLILQNQLETVAAPAGETHIQVDLDSQYGFIWDGPTYFDKSQGSYTSGKNIMTFGSAPLIVTNDATLSLSAQANWGGTIELHGAHLIGGSQSGGELLNLQGSTVDFGSTTHRLGLSNYVQDASSSLTLKIAGTTPGSEFDWLNPGSASLAGTLNLTTMSPLVGGLCGQMLTILSGSLSGQFATITGLSLAPGRSWGPLYNANSLKLRGFDPTAKIGFNPNPVDVAEGGTSVSYSACLSQQPTADVTVSFTPNSEVFGQGNPVLIPAAYWYQPVSWWIGANDDNKVEPLVHSGTMSHSLSSADPFYNGADGVLNVNVTDNDGNADLALSISSAPPPISLNQTFSVTFKERDLGTTLSTGATFSVPVSAAFRLVSANGTTCSAQGGVLQCQLTGVATGGQQSFTLKLKAVQRGTFSFTMSLAGQQPDPNLNNNSLTKSLTVN